MVAAAGRTIVNETAIPVEMIGGLPIAVIDRACSAWIMLDAAAARRDSNRPALVFTSANGQVLSMCARDAEIRRLFVDADLVHADGKPIVFASRLLCRNPLPERVATTDLFHDVAKLAQARGATFYLLGAPAEQRFAMRNRRRLDRVGIVKTSGGLFDFLSGRNRRAPRWMQAAGLEWAFRTWLEPRRLAGRYLATNPHALFRLLPRAPISRWSSCPRCAAGRPHPESSSAAPAPRRSSSPTRSCWRRWRRKRTSSSRKGT